MLHIHSIIRTPQPKRCNVRAAARVRADIHRELRDEIEEAKFDASRPSRIVAHRAESMAKRNGLD